MSSTDWETGGGDAERVNPDELDDAPAGSAEDVGDVEEGGQWTPGGGELGAEGESEASVGGAGAEDSFGAPGASTEEEGRI